MAKIINEPRLRQHLALAYHIERALKEGKAEDFSQISNWLHISHPRLLQIVNLTLLAPDIQKEILLSTDDKINSLPKYKTREITNEFDWEKQRIIWQKLTNTSLPFTANS
ncbi:MAG: hypothetical protein ISS26_02810 [Candidatus Omnitrophica bacterium]|nr:hypothetical protein [Candidatus Omnitrophota bacterium]